MRRWDFALAWDESESVHFVQAQRHLFAWHSPNAEDMENGKLLDSAQLQIKGVYCIYPKYSDFFSSLLILKF